MEKSWGAYKWTDNKFSFNEKKEGERERDYLKSTAVAAASLLIAFTGVTQVLPAAYNYTGGVVVDGIHLAIGHQEIENPYLFDPQPVEGADGAGPTRSL